MRTPLLRSRLRPTTLPCLPRSRSRNGRCLRRREARTCCTRVALAPALCPQRARRARRCRLRGRSRQLDLPVYRKMPAKAASSRARRQHGQCPLRGGIPRSLCADRGGATSSHTRRLDKPAQKRTTEAAVPPEQELTRSTCPTQQGSQARWSARNRSQRLRCAHGIRRSVRGLSLRTRASRQAEALVPSPGYSTRKPRRASSRNSS